MIVLRNERNIPRNPQALQGELQSLASRLGVRLQVKLEGRYPKGPNGENLPSYSVASGCEIGGSVGQAENIVPLIEEILKPAGQGEIEAWLAELSVLVAKRADDEFTETLRLEAYASRLAQYPADVAYNAVLGSTWKFWPTWDELRQICEQHTTPRKHMLAACLNPINQQQIEPDRQRVDGLAAQKICEEAGFTPKRFGQIAKMPMSLSFKDAEVEQKKAKPHWSDSASEDDPRWDQLRKARAQNSLMNVREAAE